MAADFGVSYGLMNLSISGYLAMTAVLHLIIGPLSDRYGRRRLTLISLAIFVVASIGCIFADNIYIFLFFRLLQSAVATGMTLSRAIIRDMAGPQEAARRMGHVNMAMALAPMLGPVFGGVLDELFGWRAGFYAFTVLGLVIFWLCWIDLGETNKVNANQQGSYLADWPQLLRSQLFWSYTVCIAFAIGAFHIFITGTPLVAQANLGLSPAVVGICIGLITAGFVVGNAVSSRMIGRYSMTQLMVMGRITGILGLTAGLAFCLAGWANLYSIFGGAVLVGFGNGLTLPSASAGCLSVKPSLAGSASGISGAAGVAAGAVLTFMTGYLLTPQNGPVMLLSLMMVSVVISLIAALNVGLLTTRQERMIVGEVGSNS